MRRMRRSDRQMQETDALCLLHTAEYGVLSMAGSKGDPYGVPLNFCVIGNGIYFHCAPEGHKIDHLTLVPKVSLCVVGRTEVLPSKFSTRYESVIVFGGITEVFEGEKRLALEGLVRKYAADYLEDGLIYVATSHAKTRVFRISMDTVTGKARD
ncbi:pyridoxamine 5'-phosphate oxidase family protein [Desulfobotulus sp. H1]|uniref:Pyridoxamine 5'-phosphate oxidase family protein n=1 Tax=Desulfobotulus pelophilus TaxID=2823377 RepID=A0ABT3N6B5_9BACT|nr:pyridoxamine 5'-phosphate oxidase family protein [Desulfobotulus pelophilus]MCW7752998.1 pyridoxamine 5'-phosphate oxidase family protein [Desulfobotulus pelophilus]